MDYKRRPYPNRLKVIRQNAGVRQLHIAKLLGHHNSNALSLWEKGEAMPNGTNLIKLCILYSKTLNELYPEYSQRLAQRLQEQSQ